MMLWSLMVAASALAGPGPGDGQQPPLAVGQVLHEAGKPIGYLHSKLAELATSKTGVAASETTTMVSAAETRFPQDYDFWKAPDDPNFELHAGTHHQICAAHARNQARARLDVMRVLRRGGG